MNEGATIYIVDDDNAYRKALVMLASAKGYGAVGFASAEELLAAPLSSYSCLLLDMRMPGLSGLQLQHALAGRDNIPPIIFMTGDIHPPAKSTAIKAGAIDVLTKPITANELFAVIETALARIASRDTQRRS